MTVYFVSNAMSFKKLFPRIIIQAVEIEKKGDIRLDIGYPVDFIVGTRFGIRRISGHCDEGEGRRYEESGMRRSWITEVEGEKNTTTGMDQLGL